MLFTVYDNHSFYNIEGVSLQQDPITMYTDILLHIQGKIELITLRANTYGDYIKLNIEVNIFINRFIYAEIQSKQLNKNLYKSWRGEVMLFQTKIKQHGIELLTELGYILNIMTKYSKDYVYYNLYSKFLKIATIDELYIVKQSILKENLNHLLLVKSTGGYLILRIESQQQTVISILNNMIDNLRGYSTEDKELKSVNNYITSENFSKLCIKDNFITLDKLKELITQQTGYEVTIETPKGEILIAGG